MDKELLSINAIAVLDDNKNKQRGSKLSPNHSRFENRRNSVTRSLDGSANSNVKQKVVFANNTIKEPSKYDSNNLNKFLDRSGSVNSL